MKDEAKVNVGVKVKPSTLNGIKADAEKDDRTVSYIAAQILDKHYSIKTVSVCEEFHFNQFWEAGMRKVGDKKKAKSRFVKILRSQKVGTDHDFTQFIVHDIQKRLNINQLGFDAMHPTTYLNGERWNDEIKGPTNGQSNGRQPDNKQTGFDRVHAAYNETFPEEADISAVGDADPSV